MRQIILFTLVFFIGCSTNKSEEDKVYSKLMHTMQLTEDNSCVNIILTTACSKYSCSKHISAVKVTCSSKIEGEKNE